MHAYVEICVCRRKVGFQTGEYEGTFKGGKPDGFGRALWYNNGKIPIFSDPWSRQEEAGDKGRGQGLGGTEDLGGKEKRQGVTDSVRSNRILS